ncbi:MAG TPA: hypothetical protein VET65_13025 [Candidatus Limnocylindrales bacterium]|nr:hypothetical protein [Candidatus Limnocylindrales bacterium]
MADSWTREHVAQLDPGPSSLHPTLILVSATGDALTRELGALSGPSDGGLASLIPQQGIIRILRELGARAAALVATTGRDEVALQIADVDHEEMLTARIIRPEQGAPRIGKWDFSSVRGPLRLRPLLRTVRTPSTTTRATSTDADTASTPAAGRPAAPAPARPPKDGASAGRRGQVRELREELGQPAAAAPSWLQ